MQARGIVEAMVGVLHAAKRLVVRILHPGFNNTFITQVLNLFKETLNKSPEWRVIIMS
jgi:hypothetical protein